MGGGPVGMGKTEVGVARQSEITNRKMDLHHSSWPICITSKAGSDGLILDWVLEF